MAGRHVRPQLPRRVEGDPGLAPEERAQLSLLLSKLEEGTP